MGLQLCDVSCFAGMVYTPAGMHCLPAESDGLELPQCRTRWPNIE